MPKYCLGDDKWCTLLRKYIEADLLLAQRMPVPGTLVKACKWGDRTWFFVLFCYNGGVAATILRTKLFIPPLRPLLVSRPRLLDRLNRGADGKLILVSAPAGFGKTTLITHWLQQQKRPIAWLSLDENDNAPHRFFTYLLAAMQTVHPEVGQSLMASLQSNRPPEDEDIMPALVNELVVDGVSLVVVLDDYHVIQNQRIHEALDFLINFMPPHIHLVMTSREDPNLPLPRWRVRGQMTEVRAADLRFTMEEATAFLQTTMGLMLDETAVSQLETRTEGWVAGLQLAALSLRQGGDTSQFINSFTGDDRQVADYLLQEVLLQQTEPVQQFLLQTAVLERFNAALCNALLEQSHSQDILDQLESANLFLIPLDAQRNWYRFHHLFAQLLRSRLLRDSSETAVAALHRRAAEWFEAQNLFEEAITHACQIPDDEYTAQLIANVPIHTVFEQGGTALIQQWVGDLPVDIIRKYPRTAVFAAGAHLLVGEAPKVEYYLELIADDPATIGERALFQSILLRNKVSDHEEALRLAQKAVTHLSKSERSFRAMAYMQVGVNQYSLGQITLATETLKQMRQQLDDAHLSTFGMELQTIQMQSGLAMTLGDFFHAEQLCHEGLALAEALDRQANPFVSLLYGQLARIYYEWNLWSQAEMYSEKLKGFAQRTAISDIIIESYLMRARLACLHGDEAGLVTTLENLRQYANSSDMDNIMETFNAVAAYFHWLAGDLDTAVRWANASNLALDDVPTFDKFSRYETLCRIRLSESQALDEKAGAVSVLRLNERLIELATEVQDQYGLIVNLGIRALLFAWLDEEAKAQAALAQLLPLAEAASLVRLFVEFGEPMAVLLRRSRALSPVYVARLLQAFVQEEDTAVPPSPVASSTQENNIHLTARETEVLQAIASGLSNKEIETALVISKNTVRTHIKNLYSKLGVESRTQAIALARELNLLTPPQ